MPLVGFRGALRVGDRGSVPRGRSGDGGAVLGSAETRAPSHGWRRAPRKRHGVGRYRYRPDRISRRRSWVVLASTAAVRHFTAAARMAARRSAPGNPTKGIGSVIPNQAFTEPVGTSFSGDGPVGVVDDNPQAEARRPGNGAGRLIRDNATAPVDCSRWPLRPGRC